MKRFLAILLSVALSCMMIPAYADETSAQEKPQADDLVIGFGENARTLSALLQAGDYAPGRVLVQATSDFGSNSRRSFGASAWEESSLYSFDVQAGHDEPTPFRLSASEPNRVLKLESNSLTTEEMLRRLADAPGVIAAEPDYMMSLVEPEQTALAEPAVFARNRLAARAGIEASTNDPLLDAQWQLSSTARVAGGTNVRDLWRYLGIPGNASLIKEVVVAVIDSGVDYAHPDLRDSMWQNPGNIGLEGEHGYNFFDHNDDPQDIGTHGTHVAGIVAATVNNSIGGAGVAPNAKIMAMRIADKNGLYYTALAVEAYAYMKRAAEGGVPLVAANNSWGSPSFSYIFDAVMDDLYRTEGILSICASGNSSNDHDLIPDNPSNGSPEAIISVNAVDATGALATFSNFGAAGTDLAAPGVAVMSTVPVGGGSIDLEDANTLLSTDDFERDPGLFAFAAMGSPSTVAERTDQVWAGSAPSGHSMKWSIYEAKLGSEESLILGPANVKTAITAPGKTVDDVRYFGFSARMNDNGKTGADRIVHAYVSSTDPAEPWLKVPLDASSVSGNNAWKPCFGFLSEEMRNKVDWENLSIKISRVVVSVEVGMDMEFFVDDVSFASSLSPYSPSSGTSMASPAVAGAVALLAAVFPDEDAATLRARILGGVSRSDKLEGTCTSDGQLDLIKAATDPYPVVDALALASDGSNRATVRGSWFGEEAGRVLLDGQVLQVAAWSASSIEVIMPDSLQTQRRYVKVEHANNAGQTGRRLLITGSHESPSEDESEYFESLTAPDLTSLDLLPLGQFSPWNVVAANGKLYAAGLFLITTGHAPRYQMLSYDPALDSWSVEAALSDAFANPFLLASHGDSLYLFETETAALFRYDPKATTLEKLFDCGAVFVAGGIDNDATALGKLVCDGRSVWICGGYDPSSSGISRQVVRLDLQTGEAELLDPLTEGRTSPAANRVNGRLVIAAGVANLQQTRLVPSVEIAQDSGWELMSLPDGVTSNQSGYVASGVLPAGASVDGVSTVGERMILAGLNGAGYADADTYVFDPTSGSWQTISKKISASKVVFGDGAVLNGAFYVLGADLDSHASVLKRLKFEPPSKPTDGGEEFEDAEKVPGKNMPVSLAATGDPLAARGVFLAMAAIAAVALLGSLRLVKARKR